MYKQYVEHYLFVSLLFAEADRYEMQTVSIASPMTSPQRYSPSVYSLQVIHLYYHHAHVFIIMIPVYLLP